MQIDTPVTGKRRNESGAVAKWQVAAYGNLTYFNVKQTQG